MPFYDSSTMIHRRLGNGGNDLLIFCVDFLSMNMGNC